MEEDTTGPAVFKAEEVVSEYRRLEDVEPAAAEDASLVSRVKRWWKGDTAESRRQSSGSKSGGYSSFGSSSSTNSSSSSPPTGSKPSLLDRLTPWKSSSSTETSGLGTGFLAESDQLPSSSGLGITGAVVNHSPNTNSTLIHKWGPGGSSALQKSNSLTSEDMVSTSSTGTGGVSTSGAINGGSYTWGTGGSSSSFASSVKTNPVPVPLTTGPSNDGLSTSPSSIRSDKTTSSVLSAVTKAITSGPGSGAKSGNYVQIKETSQSPDGKFMVDDL